MHNLSSNAIEQIKVLASLKWGLVEIHDKVWKTNLKAMLQLNNDLSANDKLLLSVFCRKNMDFVSHFKFLTLWLCVRGISSNGLQSTKRIWKRASTQSNVKFQHNPWCAETSIANIHSGDWVDISPPSQRGHHLEDSSVHMWAVIWTYLHLTPLDSLQYLYTSPDPQQLTRELPKGDEGSDGHAHHPSQPLGGAFNKVQGVSWETDS